MASGARIAETLLACGLGSVFLFAGTVKLIYPDQLRLDILSYQLVGPSLAYWIAVFLPPLELVAGGGMFLRLLRMESAVILSALSFVFTVVLISAWVRGIDVDCGCFGRAEMTTNYPMVLGRDLLLMVAGVVVVLLCGGLRGNRRGSRGDNVGLQRHPDA